MNDTKDSHHFQSGTCTNIGKTRELPIVSMKVEYIFYFLKEKKTQL
jgi:hypothetical protein